MILLIFDSERGSSFIDHCSISNFFNMIANERNIILELHRQGKRVCEISGLLQVLHPSVSKESRNSRSLAMTGTDREEAEIEL